MRLRKKAWLIISIVSSVFLIISCFICNYQLSSLSFLSSLLIPFLFLINIFFIFFWRLKKKKNLIFPLLSLILYFLFFNNPFQLNGSQKKDEPNTFSFMTFNLRSFGSTHSYRNLENGKKILDFIKEQNPDIICFQEFSKFEFESFSYYPQQFIGYRPNFEKTLQVIYSKHPIVDKGYVDFPETRNQTIYADIRFKNDTIRVYNIHLQSFKLLMNRVKFNFEGASKVMHKVDFAQKKQEEQVQIILNHAKKFKGKVIFTGDFNNTQYSENYINLKNNKTDTFVEAGFGLGTTYPLFNYPFRIDYILVDDGIDILSHQNFDLKLSDHEPILTKLAIK